MVVCQPHLNSLEDCHDRKVTPQLTEASPPIIRQDKARGADTLEAAWRVGARTKEANVGVFITFIYICRTVEFVKQINILSYS